MKGLICQGSIYYSVDVVYMVEMTSKVWTIIRACCSLPSLTLALLHSEWPKLHRVSAVLSAVGLKIDFFYLVSG